MSSTPTSLRNNPRMPSDFVAWVRRVNDRWLVHQSLNVAANEYLDVLAAENPDRLETVCRAAWLLVGLGGLMEDPKPLFYGALFGLATPEEARRFLSEHLFTLVASPAGEGYSFEELGAGMNRCAYDKALALRPRIAKALREARTHPDLV